MFDDCYLHRAVNKTTEKRLVLILDVRREFGRPWLDWFNRTFLRYLANQSENQETKTLVDRWVT
jgi:aspartyl/asparaginyl beta-hydroxylase (cupin superfamily)